MSGEKAPAEGNRDYWIKIVERSTRDLHDRVDMRTGRSAYRPRKDQKSASH